MQDFDGRPSVTTISVATADVAPAVAPYRISNKATKDDAIVTFVPVDEGLLPSEDLLPEDDADGLLPGAGGRPVIAYRFTTGTVGPYVGTEVSHKGRVASEGLACSEALVCEDFESPAGTELVEQVEYAETGGVADGPLAVSVWANFTGEWV